MAILKEYHKPTSVSEALALLARTDVNLVPLAGGTRLVGALETRTAPGVDGVVDLGGLPLRAIRAAVVGGEPCLSLGALATLSEAGEHAGAAALAGGLLVRAAHGEGPVNLRNQATVGGVVAAAEPDSEFYAALLALDARVVTANAAGERVVPLAELGAIDGLITAVLLPEGIESGAIARVARTPSDRPIVAAVAVRHVAAVRVALCGVAARPILDGAPLDPPDDYRGSAAYRRSMVAVLKQRALADLTA